MSVRVDGLVSRLGADGIDNLYPLELFITYFKYCLSPEDLFQSLTLLFLQHFCTESQPNPNNYFIANNIKSLKRIIGCIISPHPEKIKN